MNEIIEQIARNSRRNEYGELVFDSAVCLREVIKIDAALPEIVGEFDKKTLKHLSTITANEKLFRDFFIGKCERELEIRFFENQLAVGKLVDQWEAESEGHDQAYDKECASANY